MSEPITRQVALLKAAADETRLRLLHLCQRGHLTMKELAEILGVSLPNLTWHLKILAEVGLVSRSKEGTRVYVRISSDSSVKDLISVVLNDEIVAGEPFCTDLERAKTVRLGRSEKASQLMHDHLARWNNARDLYADEAKAESAVVELLLRYQLDDLLDIGTGTGGLLRAASSVVRSGVGIDIDHGMLAIARDRLDKEGLGHITILYGDLFDAPFDRDQRFGAVALFQVLHFADDPEAAVAQCAQWVAPGGVLIVADFMSHTTRLLLDDYGHLWPGFSTGQVQDWITGAGLEAAKPDTVTGGRLPVGVWHGVKPAN